MKIAFDAKRAFLNNTGLGNYSRFVIRSLAQAFPENNYLLLSPRLGQHPEAQALLDYPQVEAVLPTGLVQKLKLGSVWRSLSPAKKAKQMGASLYHGLSNELPLNTAGLKTVVTMHDLLFLRYPHLYNLVDVSIYKQKARLACQKADRVVAVSEQTAQDVVDFLKIPAKKIRVVYQGVHPSFKEEYDSYLLQRVASKYKLPDDFILFVGTLETRKNALLILQALNLLKGKSDLPVVLVGKPTSYKKQLEEYIKQHHLQEKVIFLHNVSFEDLPKVYQQSSMFVYPSVFEGFGIPIVEALVSKVPVITSLGSCFAEAGGPNSIYINPNDPEELADAILRVHNNPTMATKMTIDGIAHALNFEDDKLAADLMKVYREI